jgi:hypothetical protein
MGGAIVAVMRTQVDAGTPVGPDPGLQRDARTNPGKSTTQLTAETDRFMSPGEAQTRDRLCLVLRPLASRAGGEQ